MILDEGRRRINVEGAELAEDDFAKSIKCTTTDGFQTHWRIYDLDNPRFCARQLECFMTNYDIMRQLDHNCVVRCFGSEVAMLMTPNFELTRVAIIEQELVTEGNLYSYVSFSGAFSEKMCRYYCNQLLEGIQYLHG